MTEQATKEATQFLDSVLSDSGISLGESIPFALPADLIGKGVKWTSQQIQATVKKWQDESQREQKEHAQSLHDADWDLLEYKRELFDPGFQMSVIIENKNAFVTLLAKASYGLGSLLKSNAAGVAVANAAKIVAAPALAGTIATNPAVASYVADKVFVKPAQSIWQKVLEKTGVQAVRNFKSTYLESHASRNFNVEIDQKVNEQIEQTMAQPIGNTKATVGSAIAASGTLLLLQSPAGAAAMGILLDLAAPLIMKSAGAFLHAIGDGLVMLNKRVIRNDDEFLVSKIKYDRPPLIDLQGNKVEFRVNNVTLTPITLSDKHKVEDIAFWNGIQVEDKQTHEKTNLALFLLKFGKYNIRVAFDHKKKLAYLKVPQRAFLSLPISLFEKDKQLNIEFARPSESSGTISRQMVGVLFGGDPTKMDDEVTNKQKVLTKIMTNFNTQSWSQFFSLQKPDKPFTEPQNIPEKVVAQLTERRISGDLTQIPNTFL